MHSRRVLIACLSLPVLFTACSLWILIRRTTFRSGWHLRTRHDADGSARDRRSSKEAFVSFNSSVELDQFPWTQLDYGRWRRRLAEPEAVEVDRPIAAGHEVAEIHRVLHRAADQLQHETGNSSYSPADSVGGRLRFLHGLGVQYEVYFRDRAAAAAEASETPSATANTAPNTAANSSEIGTIDYHMVRLVQPMGDLEVEYVGRSSNRLVHIILPYFHRPAALETFLARFTKLAQGPSPLRSSQKIALTVVRFSEGLPAMDEAEEREDRSTARALVAVAAQELGGFVPAVRLLEVEGRFSAGAGWLAAAAATSKEDDIVMLAQVDLLFGKSFLQRCRANTRPGERVYYPMVFSTYNPHIAYGVFKKNVHSVQKNYDRKLLIDSDLGYWLESDYSVSCQYLSDFRGLSEPFEGNAGLGYDVLLYERYVKSGMDVIRMPDPDLVQVYRKVTCLKEMGREEYSACLKTKAMNEASQMEWGLWVFKNLGDTDEVKKFVKMVGKAELPIPTP